MQVVLKSYTFDFYRNSCPPMNGCYKMQTFEQLQRVRLVPRTAQAGKGVLFQPGYIAAADAELCGDLLLRLRDGAIQAVPQGQNLLLALRQGGNQLAQLSGGIPQFAVFFHCGQVGQNIREMDSCYKNSEKIECVLEWNKGNHFQDVDVRCGKGFLWCMGENICKINNCKTNRDRTML